MTTDNPTQLENKPDPCPLCGCKVFKERFEKFSATTQGILGFSYRCPKCRSQFAVFGKSEAEAMQVWNSRAPVVAPQGDACADCATAEREAWRLFNDSHKGSASLRCENHRDPSPSSLVPQEQKLRDVDERVNAAVQRMDASQQVDCATMQIEFNAAATPTPVSLAAREAAEEINCLLIAEMNRQFYGPNFDKLVAILNRHCSPVPAAEIPEWSNEHREQAREIAERVVSEWNTTPPYVAGTSSENLINAISDALSSRDAEIKEVLEGLGVELPNGWCWCPGMEWSVRNYTHTNACKLTQALYAKLQPVQINGASSTPKG